MKFKLDAFLDRNENLSFPFDHSVNDGIFKSEFPVSYSKVDDAIRLIVKTGKGALMGKIDIKNAYWIIPIHPDDRYLLGMKWRCDQYFVDLALRLFHLACALPRVFSTPWPTVMSGFYRPTMTYQICRTI